MPYNTNCSQYTTIHVVRMKLRRDERNTATQRDPECMNSPWRHACSRMCEYQYGSSYPPSAEGIGTISATLEVFEVSSKLRHSDIQKLEYSFKPILDQDSLVEPLHPGSLGRGPSRHYSLHLFSRGVETGQHTVGNPLLVASCGSSELNGSILPPNHAL